MCFERKLSTFYEMLAYCNITDWKTWSKNSYKNNLQSTYSIMPVCDQKGSKQASSWITDSKLVLKSDSERKNFVLEYWPMLERGLQATRVEPRLTGEVHRGTGKKIGHILYGMNQKLLPIFVWQQPTLIISMIGWGRYSACLFLEKLACRDNRRDRKWVHRENF